MKLKIIHRISRRLILVAFVFTISELAIAQVSKDSIPLSLNEAWSRANTYSKKLRLSEFDKEIGKEKVIDAKRERLPVIGIEGSYGQLSNIPIFVDGVSNDAEFIHLEDHTTYSAGVEAYFNLYNGNKTNIHITKAETRQELLSYLEEETSAVIHFKVAEAYLDMQRSMEFNQLILQNIKRNEKRLDQITKLYENGVVLKSDLLRAKLQLSRQQTNLLEMKNNVELATQSLNILVGFNDEQPIQPTDSIQVNLLKAAKTYRDYRNDALEISPLMKIADKEIELKKLQEEELKADKLPKIGLFGDYTYSYPQIKLYPYETAPYLLGVAGIKLSYDVSALYHDKHKEEAAKIAVDRQKLVKENTQDKLRKGVKAAYKHLEEDVEKIVIAKMNIEQAKESYRIVNQTYFNQLSLLTDLLDADTQLLQAKFELVNNQISAKLHYYQLLKITGEL
ncbi:TolC family protein [Mesonia aestuariivivens]|uniref:TolC family protein n=1 Tax=Mesonia aestuariivivens TaxID=2796128 RepID=A0ABS6VXC4_9FLAO|nr:TolC family protein [Mesonia aestuariivivens]MBW2960241.1 TolC family protein [Mesonia aestuariivivens]